MSHMKIFLAGHNNFGNRGCEALVRSITGLVRRDVTDAEFLCPSRMPELDAVQWPEASSQGITFVPDSPMSRRLRWWGRAERLMPAATRRWVPPSVLDAGTAQLIERSDVVILTGGDVLSLEYGLPSLFHWVGVIEQACDRGKPAILWGASVGPFSSEPAVEERMVKHLRRYAHISVRETETLEYLRRLGITNVMLVADPAFTLEPEPFDADDLTFGGDDQVLGLNVSPLIRKLRGGPDGATSLDEEVLKFVSTVLKDTSYKILLIPHVDPLDGNAENSDGGYLRTLLQRAGGTSGRLQLAPSTLNAAQLKYLIAQCHHFVGARTHATIAAFSSAVPTLSIAYSAKAKGINRDLFGDARYLVSIDDLSCATLVERLDRLRADDSTIRALLQQRKATWRHQAATACDSLRLAALASVN
jgi:colanic acid/amylovoran biosynthesis protein